MHGIRRRTVGLLLAILLTLGATSQCIAALLCQAGLCAEGCAMSAKAPAEKKCCPEKEPPSKAKEKSDCCCEWGSGPDTLPPVPVAIPLSFDIPIDAEAPAALLPSVSPPIFEPIFGFTDSSPPPEPCSSQHDRAPPAA